MKADIARIVIIAAVLFCFSYTVRGIIRFLIKTLTSGGLSESMIILRTDGDCKELERSLFSALAAEPASVIVAAENLTEEGKRICNAAQNYGGVILFESISDAAEYIKGQFKKGT